MSEDALWTRTRTHLGPLGRLVRIENPIDPGTPDVCYLLRRYPKVAPVCGWLELKHVPEWPKRPGTVFKIPSLTLEQVNWQTHWALAGGRVMTLLQVADDLVLLDHHLLAQLFSPSPIEGHTRNSLLASAPLVSPRVFPTAELVKWLTRT